jgi:toxin ParE1/3/4
MSVEVIFAPETERDLFDPYYWYEAQRTGLGAEFLSCIEASVASISRFPETYEIVHEQYRRKLVRRFPYAIFYEYVSNVVTIYCTFHTSRDPDRWRQRLQ